MSRAASVCAEPGCPNLATNQGRCPQHQLAKSRPGSTWRYRKQRAQAIARDHGICWICGQPGADSADHVHRVRDGGADELSNLAAAHLRCNIRRG